MECILLLVTAGGVSFKLACTAFNSRMTEFSQIEISTEIELLTLPEDTLPESAEAASSVVDKLPILIVDDSRTVRKHFAAALSDRYECFEAATVTQAFDLLRMKQFALVLADIIMPGLSGVELLRRIVESYPDTAVIMVSGVDRPEWALDAIRLGAFDHLIKPCGLFVLQLTIERALEQRELLQNAKRYQADLEIRIRELTIGKDKLERLQAQIVHSEKMASIGQLAAGVAHELNNPVGFIHANLELLKDNFHYLIALVERYDSLDASADVAEQIKQIKQNVQLEVSPEDLASIIKDCTNGAERIREIVQNLRTFFRLDEAEFHKTDIHEGLGSTARLLSQYFSSERVRLIRNYGEVPLIDAFGGQLNQVWMNLLANAAQAVCRSGGEVRISTRSEGDMVIVDITDDGDGIAAEHIDRILDPFFTTKPVGEGTGLGLSISFGIVKRHFGEIISSEPGKGTTFSVILPIRADRALIQSSLNEEFDFNTNSDQSNSYELQNTYC